MMDWFNVDRKGLAQLLERKGKEFVLYELIQNAWDENTRFVTVSLTRSSPGSRNATLVVSDDNPEGFADLTHAFTLFAESAKKSDAEKRGRFNLGEKLVLALCSRAEIVSTTGGVRFDAQGRHTLRQRRDNGTTFAGTLRMTDAEIERCGEAVRRLLPPANIQTIYNDVPLVARPVIKTITEVLPTEISDASGVLLRASRQTRIEIVEPTVGEPAMLYEMGIPVVETGDRYHVNVLQKVPLNFDRDNVTPSYLARVRALIVEHMHQSLTVDDANQAWVRQAVQAHGDKMDDTTIRHLTTLRFGEKSVAYDPSDQEANSRATAAGYTVVHGGSLAKSEWESIRRAGALLPAGLVTPSPKPFVEGGKPLRTLDRAEWSPEIRGVVAYIGRIAPKLIGVSVDVTIANDVSWGFSAAYGGGSLTINLARLGHKWFDGSLPAINDLLIHEFGHQYASNHLSEDYYRALTKLGANLTQLALDEPELFEIKKEKLT